MNGDRPGTTTVLIDIQYHASMNAFEEFYGDSISYHEIEQISYVEFKEILFEKINRSIKFRKYGRIGPVLTIKADMTKEEIDKFKKLLERNEIRLLHNWVVTNVTIITDKLSDSKEHVFDDEEFDENEDI